MEIRQLQYFLVLCEKMNYTHAAQALFLSRQALRQSIAALEAELCGPLFKTTHNHLSLTEKGVNLRMRAEPIVASFEQMRAAVYADIHTEHPIRLGISVALIPDYLPSLGAYLEQFRRRYPGIEISCEAALHNDAVLEGVQQRRLDAGLVMDMGGTTASLQRTTLTEDPTCLLVARGHPFWEKKQVSPAELRGQHILLPGLQGGCFLPLWEACEKAGFTPDAEIGPSYYQVNFQVQERGCICINRFELFPRNPLDRVRNVMLEGVPPLCAAFIQPEGQPSSTIRLLRDELKQKLQLQK